jgi:iron(III) transport system substrate-binding protein
MCRIALSFYGLAIVGALVFPASLPAQQAAGEAQWRAEWEKVVAGAKKEGKLNMVGPRGGERQQALTEIFSKKYGVEVEYFPAGGFEVPPRVQRERQAGLYLWDVFIAGTTTLFKGLRPLGALEPIEPALILPEVKDPKNWRGGELPFFDKNRVGLSLLRGSGQYLFINTTLVKAEEFKSWRDLLNPKLKGKIVMGRDPRVSGYGNATFKFFFTDKSLGPDFIRDLLKQDIKLLRDDRMGVQWLAQGRYAVCICSDLETQRLMDQNLPISAIDGRQLKEGTHVTSAFANVSLANRPPHPHAAKLYVNWVLTREAGLLFSKSADFPSMRADVPTDHVKPWSIPEPSWPVSNTEEGLEAEEPLEAFLKELLGAL